VRQLIGNQSLADDLTQESFLKAIRGLPNFHGGSAFRTWLFRIVVNTARDLHSQIWCREIEVGGQLFEPVDTSHNGPEPVAMRTELENTLAKAVEDLPSSLRLALVLTTIHEFTPLEVAEMEDCSVNTIYWRIHEARKLLQKKLEAWTT
jgi:RNA polymerase sigma-70 factor (ECF subfamily)